MGKDLQVSKRFIRQLVQRRRVKVTCKECGRRFKSPAALGGHVSSAHRGGNPNAGRRRQLPGSFEMGKGR